MIIRQKRYTREDVAANSWLTYAFGDNDQRIGESGQSLACRGFPNTIGIRTKKKPTMASDAFYTDTEYKENIRKINEDLDAVEALLKKHFIVVFPIDGFGTGLASLRVKAPETFAYLNNRLVTLLEKYTQSEHNLDASVITLNPKAFTIVPNRINASLLEASFTRADKLLRGYGVEVGAFELQRTCREVIKQVLEQNPLNIIDPLDGDKTFDD